MQVKTIFYVSLGYQHVEPDITDLHRHNLEGGIRSTIEAVIMQYLIEINPPI